MKQEQQMRQGVENDLQTIAQMKVGQIKSRVGKGSVFRVHWPRIAPSIQTAAAAPDTRPTRGAETILVVEDQDEVCEVLDQPALDAIRRIDAH